MKENVKIAAIGEKRDLAVSIGLQLLSAACGFLGARANVGGHMAPFGLCFAAGVPKEYIISASLGGAFGYFIPVNGIGGFKYLAAIVAICTIRMLLSVLPSYIKKPLWSAVTAGLASVATSLAAVSGGAFSIWYAVIESALAFGGAYFVHKSVSALSKETRGLSAVSLGSVVIVINMLLMGLYPITFSGISLGRTLAVVLLLCTARFCGASGGAVAGAALCIFITLCGGTIADSAMVFAVGGMLAGVFSPNGRLASCAVFTVFATVSSFICLGGQSAYLMLAEAVSGGIIFLLLPSPVIRAAGRWLAPPANVPSLEGLRHGLTMRMYFASEALADISGTVKSVSHELSRINTPDFDRVLTSVRDDVCRGCALDNVCWKNHLTDTRNAVLSLTGKCENRDDTAVPEGWRARCDRREKLADAVNTYYREYKSRLEAEARISEVRGVVSDQFDGLSSMLFDLAEDFSKAESFDTTLAVRLADALRDVDIHTADCAVRRDRFNRMFIELRTVLPRSAPINRAVILSTANDICGREFMPPTVTRSSESAFITLSEKAAYTLQIGASQLCCEDKSVCGDTYTAFTDGLGRAILLLSDGMGTGARAAVDSGMTAGLMERLLSAGFGYDCALRLLNSALLCKSTDESLSTVDIAAIDLYSGSAELLKVGAAPTLVRRNGKVGKAESRSLPAGILRDVNFDKARIKLVPGDVVLMMSDGVTAAGTEWISAELAAFSDETAEAFAERIARSARRYRQDGRDDDITVVVGVLEKLP